MLHIDHCQRIMQGKHWQDIGVCVGVRNMTALSEFQHGNLSLYVFQRGKGNLKGICLLHKMFIILQSGTGPYFMEYL